MISTLLLQLAAAVVLTAGGFILGRKQTLRSLNDRIAQAYNKGRTEVEAEKLKLALDFKDRLVGVKQSLKGAVESYDAAAKVVRDTLSVPTEGTAIDGPDLEDLRLEILSTSASNTIDSSARALLTETTEEAKPVLS